MANANIGVFIRKKKNLSSSEGLLKNSIINQAIVKATIKNFNRDCRINNSFFKDL
jgi:hypothetical protein